MNFSMVRNEKKEEIPVENMRFASVKWDYL